MKLRPSHDSVNQPHHDTSLDQQELDGSYNNWDLAQSSQKPITLMH